MLLRVTLEYSKQISAQISPPFPIKKNILHTGALLLKLLNMGMSAFVIVSMSTFVFVYLHTFVFVYLRTFKFVYLHTCVFVYVHGCVFVNVMLCPLMLCSRRELPQSGIWVKSRL